MTLGESLIKAEELIKRMKDSRKDKPGWNYHSVPHSHKCSNDDCQTSNSACYDPCHETIPEGDAQIPAEDDRTWCTTCFPNRTALIELEDKYNKETASERQERAYNKDEWYEIDLEEGHSFKCVDSSNCWYTGRHRTPDTLLQLKGSSIKICDVCLDNGHNSCRSVENAIEYELK